MALISRVSRLFTADVHAVLDRIEEPEVLLKQAIREMEDEVAKGEQQLKWLRHEAVQLEKKRDAGAAAVQDLDAELDVCFEAGEEQLARTLVKRKLSEEQRTKVAIAQLDSVASAIMDVSAGLDDQRNKLVEMQQSAELLTAEPVAEVRLGDAAISQDEVDVAFLREKQRRSGS
ncbi:MAG: PspA/IM30 family protein [Gammaproteobacteria bacterium]|nr:PspA/IM30 family protein [Gammaproteobacteria bacterium]